LLSLQVEKVEVAEVRWENKKIGILNSDYLFLAAPYD
jgi:hypothetical protein